MYQVEVPAVASDIALVQSANSTSTSTTVSVGGTWTAGNKLVITGVFNYVADNPSISDNGPGLTYTLEGSDQSSPNQRLMVWTADVTTGGTFNITVGVGTANRMGLGVLELSGAAAGAAEAVYQSYSPGNVQNISATISTSTDGAWVVSSVGGHNQLDDTDDPSGYTFVHSYGNGAVDRQYAMVSYKKYDTAGSANHTWNWGFYSSDSGIVAIAIAPVSSGGGGGTETVTYYHGAHVVATDKGGEMQFLHTDHLGSPVAATDGLGAVAGTQSFYPFGDVRPGGTGIFDTERSFTGQIFDGGTGLGFYNARYYDSALGRFISPDSIVADPHTASYFNRYAYVLNSPLVHTDPSGHCVLGAPCPELLREAVELVVNVAEDVGEVFSNTRQTVESVVEDVSDFRRDAQRIALERARQLQTRASGAVESTLDTVGIEEIYIETTPAGNRMPVIRAHYDGDAVTLPGVVVSPSNGITDRFIQTHEGTHYDEWAGDPFTWHLDYGVQLAADWLNYGSYDAAYEASHYEQRAYAVSNPNDPPPSFTPTPNPMRFIVEEVSSWLGF